MQRPCNPEKRRGTARIRLSAFNTLNTYDRQRLRFAIDSPDQQR